MKLIIAIMNEQDAPEVTDALQSAGYSSTVGSGYGGFLRKNSAMLYSAVDNKQVSKVLNIIRQNTHAREETIPEDIRTGEFKLLSHIKVGKAVAFVLDMEQFVRL